MHSNGLELISSGIAAENDQQAAGEPRSRKSRGAGKFSSLKEFCVSRSLWDVAREEEPWGFVVDFPLHRIVFLKTDFPPLSLKKTDEESTAPKRPRDEVH